MSVPRQGRYMSGRDATRRLARLGSLNTSLARRPARRPHGSRIVQQIMGQWDTRSTRFGRSGSDARLVIESVKIAKGWGVPPTKIGAGRLGRQPFSPRNESSRIGGGVVDAPDGLTDRGMKFWADLTATRDLDPAGLRLAHEACRISDRLDGMADVIAGRGVLNLMHFRLQLDRDTDDKRYVEMKVDGVFAEARQQANALRQIVATLGMGTSSEVATEEADPLDELNARRAARGGSGAAVS